MLTPEQESAVRTAAAQLAASADNAQRAADDAAGGISGMWANAIGAGSALDAARSDAAAQRKLSGIMSAKVPGIVERGDPDEARQFVADCGRYVPMTALLETVEWLKPSTAVVEVGVKTVVDVAKGVAGAGGFLLKWWPWILAAVGVVVVLPYLPHGRKP